MTGGNANNFTTLINYGHSIQNAPSLNGQTILTLPYSSDLRCAQIAADVESNNGFQVRRKIGGTYTGWEKLITNADMPILTVRTGTRYWTQYVETSGQKRIYFYNADFPSGDNLLGYIVLTK